MDLKALDPANYDQQLAQKCERMTTMFAPFNAPDLEVFASEPTHYRMRAEFRVWHDDDDLYYIMFDQAKGGKVRTDQFLPASELINTFMPKLMAAIKPFPALRFKLFQVDFLSSLSGELVISMLYHRQLDEAWETGIAELRQQWQQQGYKVDIIGRAKKQKICLERDYVDETLTVHGTPMQYRQIENSFTQPNGRVAEKMLEWAVDCTRNSSGDLLELYCGNGNFSLALAQNFERVLATELAKPSVESAQHNIAANHIDNVTIIRMSAEDFTDAMNGVREFRRLKGIDLTAFNCNTIFVDPPRAGLDKATEKMVQGYDRILYISCNPETLLDNLQTLGQTHKITRLALFDQFPYTHHMEAGVLLERK
ncbi:tRNA (uridine(54)-C5)-methyltransferase TrmA [Ferrimonas sp. SCSIO 43195]|uniref:tRNA (uridine(54)-C5)-methyltransferase TrmA n=1 Tax=Ferrimonas sp. SCSIO 43195 TaxID=2822844 RepID=UPI002074C34C|nr:tRNA (uridine(54)-C5)-methyltransferase TrmA [Ferrimonas sp. SCSIO 43195]USD37819.1 tRNA (uridine(54)-C5)-methyltransferase TrmA [Ferrimonas sp. SCSIO 43195]